MTRPGTDKTIAGALIVRIVAAIVLVSIFSLSIIVFVISQRTEAEYTNKAADLTENFLVSIELPLWNYEKSGITNICRTFLSGSLVSRIRLLDETGGVLFDEAILESGLVDMSTRAVVKHEGRKIGSLEIDFTFEDFRDSRRISLAVGFATILGAVLAAAFMVRSTLQRCLKAPFDKLINRMTLVAEGKYSTHDEEDEYAEIKTITSRFDDMAGQIRLREEALEASHARLKDILDSLHAGVVLIEAGERRIVDVNPEAEAMLGASAAEIIGLKCTEFFCNDVEGHRCPILDEGGPEDNTPRTIMRRDGSEINVLKTVVKISLEGKEHLLESMLDITDLKRAEEQNRRLTQRLSQAQKMEAIGTLSGGIAHDFNNVLAPILGYAELMEQGEMSELQRTRLKSITASALRAKELVQQILTFSHKGEIEKQLIEVQKPVTEVLSLLKSTLPPNITVSTDLVKTPLRVKANHTQLHQLIMNLCTNAFHAMETSGGVIHVAVSRVQIHVSDISPAAELRSGSYVKISVSDTGPGISKDILPKIFEPFFTTKEVGKGTGMGLAVVHGIATGSGGKISTYSEPGEGATFNVFLPEATSTGNARIPVKTQRPLGTEQILLVDDDTAIMGVLKEMLQVLGYSVSAFASSAEALEAFTAAPQSFDLVITDYMMPNICGTELVSSLRKIRSDFPAIISSGYGTISNEWTEAEKDNFLYLPKPVVMDTLATTVRKILDA